MGRAPNRQASSRRKHNGGRRVLSAVVCLVVAGFAAPRAPADGTDPAIPMVGRVLDERRLPVAGATVALRRSGSPEVLLAKTGSDGQFEIVAPLAPFEQGPLRSTLFVTTDDRRVGHAAARGGEARRAGGQFLAQVDPIVLEPCGRLQVEVRDSDGPVDGAAVELRLPHGSSALATAASDANGRATIDPAPVGEFVLFVFKADRGRAAVEAKIASDATLESVVELRKLRTLAVRVVDAADGAPIPGASLTLSRNAKGSNPGPFPNLHRNEPVVAASPVTDADGRIELRDLEEGEQLEIRVRADHFDEEVGMGIPIARPSRNGRKPGKNQYESRFVSADDGSVELELVRRVARKLRYRVDRESGPIPAVGTRFDVELLGEPRGCVGPGEPMPITGGVLHDDVLAVDVEWRPSLGARREGSEPAFLEGWAFADGGAVAALIASQTGEGKARFFPGAALTVTLVGPDGAPLADRRVFASLEGSSAGLSQFARWLWTDANGAVRFDRLCAGRWYLTAEGAQRIVELKEGGVAVPLSAPRPQEIVLQFTVDGERRLPTHLNCWTDDEQTQDRREDPVTGDVHVFVLPALYERERRVRVYDPKWGRLEFPLPPPTADGAPALLPVAVRKLERGSLVAQIRGGDESMRFAAERLDPVRGDFVADPPHANVQRPRGERNSTLTLTDLDPGTWRLTVPATPFRSEPVRVGGGGPAPSLEFDLTNAASVGVIWVVPDGESRDFLEVGPMSAARSWRTWRDWESEWPLPRSDEDRGGYETTHRLDIDRRTPPKLDARHPYLVPSKWNDAIDLTKPRSFITLHMELGPLLTMAPEFPDGVARTGGAFVTLVDTSVPPGLGGAADVRRALRRGDTFAMAPPAAGERRVLIDPIVAAPVELASVVFDGGPRELGPIRFARGSTLRVHARVAAPFAAPSVSARATRIDGLAYERASSIRERASAPCDPVIRGLGAGLFRIEVETGAGSRRSPWTAEVRLDGEHDAEITIATD